MNKQLIKIILFDIKSNLLSCLLLTFQMIVAFFVIGNLCSITAYKTVTVNALDGFDFPKNCYSPSSTDIYTDGGIVVDYRKLLIFGFKYSIITSHEYNTITSSAPVTI